MEIINFGVDNDKPQIMTSLEIAELTGKRHSDVMRDIREIESQITNNEGERKFALTEYFDKQGKKQPLYELTKKETLLIMSGYSVVLRMKIIDRWEDLEKSQSKVPQSFSEALFLAGELQKKVEEQQLVITEQAPKVIAFENVVDSQNTYTLDSVSDILNIGRTTLCKILEQKKWKTIKETNGTSSTRLAEEKGYAKTVFEYIKINGKDIKTKRIVLKKLGLDKLIQEQMYK